MWESKETSFQQNIFIRGLRGHGRIPKEGDVHKWTQGVSPSLPKKPGSNAFQKGQGRAKNLQCVGKIVKNEQKW